VLANRAAVHRVILTSMESLDEELIHEAIAAWNRGDGGAVLERCDPNVEWRGATELLDQPEVLYGHEGACDSWRRWMDSWTDVHAEREDTIGVEGGSWPWSLARHSLAGLDVDQLVAFHLEVRDPSVTRFVSSGERSPAFEALGLPAPG
jgi:ketosteroid isomerase-like protein